jgi:hypothetical protein
MHLNMTSIEDAWGVSDISMNSDTTNNRFVNSTLQNQHLQSHVIPKSSVLEHPNSIVESRPTRIDIAVYNPVVVEHLHKKTPEIRTAIVTDLIRASMQPEQPLANRSSEPEPEVQEREYFESDRNDNMTMLILITLLLLLVDKLISIWKNS